MYCDHINYRFRWQCRNNKIVHKFFFWFLIDRSRSLTKELTLIVLEGFYISLVQWCIKNSLILCRWERTNRTPFICGSIGRIIGKKGRIWLLCVRNFIVVLGIYFSVNVHWLHSTYEFMSCPKRFSVLFSWIFIFI